VSAAPGTAAAAQPAPGRRPRVALLLLGVHGLAGGGGTERQFADVFDGYRGERACDLWLVVDPATRSALRDAGRLARGDRVLQVPDGAGPAGWVRQAFALRRLCRAHAFDLVHIALPAPRYLPFLWLLRAAPGGRRPRVSITAVDCTLAHRYFQPRPRDGWQQNKVLWLYRLFFATAPPDGVYSWYRLFAERFSGGVLPGDPTIVAARYCFVDVERFCPAPAKRDVIVWAARLHAVKRPLLFLEGVRAALDRAPGVLEGWEFRMYGAGPMADEVAGARARLGLERRVALAHDPRLAPVFAESRAFVSTQDYENFTSLAMLEAMAAGNAVIARDVGQTRWFVRAGENGFLARDDTPDAIAEAMLAYADARERHAAFAARSRAIATGEHCLANFLADIDAYWTRVLGRACAGP